LIKVLIAHPGTQYSHHLVKQINKQGLLYNFCTGFAIAEKSVFGKLFKLLPSYLSEKINNRFIEALDGRNLKTQLFVELNAIRKLNDTNSETIFYKRNKKFQQKISNKLILDSDVVIGFDTSSWLLVERCKELGKPFFLDVSIGHPASKEHIYNELKALYPEWQEQIQPKLPKLIAIEKKEIALADIIVVPSEFVKKTYTDNGVDAARIRVNPFGTSINMFSTINVKKISNGKIKFLFFGALTARKGLPLLLDAWKMIDASKAELTIAGYGHLPNTVDLPENVINKGVVNKEDRQELYNNNHVFVFPSNFEGFAQVQIEAATFGLPIIGTFNSGATELVEDGKNGFVVKLNDKYALVNAINHFINHPNEIHIMGNEIMKKALNYTWDNYGERWVKIITSIQ
jgi:starch synthase